MLYALFGGLISDMAQNNSKVFRYKHDGDVTKSFIFLEPKSCCKPIFVSVANFEQILFCSLDTYLLRVCMKKKLVLSLHTLKKVSIYVKNSI